MSNPSLATKPKVQTMVRAEKKPFDLIIVGGGPAGLTAGIYAKRYKIDTLLLERALPGGLITTTETVDNYPGFPEGISGIDLGQKFEEQAKKFALDIVYSRTTMIEKFNDIFEVSTDDQKYSSRAIIVATGSEPKKLNVKGEKEFIGKGVSYCATCDGPFYKDKVVAVVGGGNAALEEAMYLTKHAKLVTIIHRRDAFRADKIVVEKAAANPKIFFKLDSVIDEILGEKKVTSIKVKNVKTSNVSIIAVDGVFIYAGYNPNSAIVKDLVELDEWGAIKTDDHLATKTPGLYAAGDIRTKSLRQVVTAVGDGAIAAESVNKFLGF